MARTVSLHSCRPSFGMGHCCSGCVDINFLKLRARVDDLRSCRFWASMKERWRRYPWTGGSCKVAPQLYKLLLVGMCPRVPGMAIFGFL